MKKNKLKFIHIILCFVTAAGILISAGCSSSSNSIRYESPKETPNENNTDVRFSSDKEQNTDTTFADNQPALNDSDDIPVNEKGIDISVLMKKLSSNDKGEKLTADQSTLREKMLMEIIKYLDTPYKYGGQTSNGIDCSAFTQKVYQKTLSVNLLRSAHEQFTEGIPVDDVDGLKFGDLVFFNTRRGIKPGHVGIYIGDHLFAHASRSNGVIVSSLDEEYYSRRFMGGRRIENTLGSKVITGNN